MEFMKIVSFVWNNNTHIRRNRKCYLFSVPICLSNSLYDRLCGLVVSVEGYKHRGPGFDSRALLRIFLRELGLERGRLSLVIG
jgi:hypothetical protein